MALDMMSMPDPGVGAPAAPGNMGLWDTLMGLAQRSTEQKGPQGLGGLIGNTIGGGYAPTIGWLWDLLGQRGTMATPPFAAPPGQKRQMPSGQGRGSMQSMLQLLGLV
jgi:hypothetical protein